MDGIRNRIRALELADEAVVLDDLIRAHAPDAATRDQIGKAAEKLVNDIRADNDPGLMEVFLAEYGLSTQEGVALMCLAEALLRVPDDETIDDLIEDKIAPSAWGEHLGHSSSSLVNASTWALMLTGRVLDEKRSSGMARILHGAVKRLGEPVIRKAVRRAMKELGSQFVLGETIEAAVRRGMSEEKKGYTYSYDMLGEAALTAGDAENFFAAYDASIAMLSTHAKSLDIRENPGISVKLSALHPRYELGQKARVMSELTARVLDLALSARAANMGFNIDAEEADRLDLSLDVIEAVLSDDRLSGWDGFGVVVQAYGKRAAAVIDWLYALAERLDRKIMVRLVKGAYWDTEIKRAQVMGLKGFPVFNRKAATDISYICCSAKLLAMTDRIYPQFATHNAHTVASILARAPDDAAFEFQRLHGMGEALHRLVIEREKTRCRIYAPVGAHEDLLAYLVRRLIENGANSSFVNRLVDKSVPASAIVADPFETLALSNADAIIRPVDLFAPERRNSGGFDLRSANDLAAVDAARERFRSHRWHAKPLMAATFTGEAPLEIRNPAAPDDLVGTVIEASVSDVEAALAAARDWSAASGPERAAVLNRVADLYEENFGEFFAVLTREAGKTPADAIAELREAVDFLRYYAAGIDSKAAPRGLFACISPWNFPLAIFTGQIAAALAAGNGVLAKPADPTPIVAMLAVEMMHKAGVPVTALQLLPGDGARVGARLVADPRISGTCFTGSTATAQTINRAMANAAAPDAPLIAETGGLNAMIVDSTALPQQAVKDIVASSFQSAGQRCSALRVLYVQDDVADHFLAMLFGAMDELVMGDPWHYATDVGPLINEAARRSIQAYVDAADAEGRVLKKLNTPSTGLFVAPTVIRVSGIADLNREIFGPVLHVARFEAEDIDRIVTDINGSGYGLTFGLHTRIDGRVEHLTSKLHVGNIYVNRNQIGAVVGSQPFGGEGLSGTGPKAGGPHYLKAFTKPRRRIEAPVSGEVVTAEKLKAELAKAARPRGAPLKTLNLPGPTGESNRLSILPRGVVLCLGPGLKAAREQADMVRASGSVSFIVAPGHQGAQGLDGALPPALLTEIDGFDAVAFWGNDDQLRPLRRALAARKGAILPLLTEEDIGPRCVIERHVCVDTTAAGGNASLLAKAS